MTAPGRQSSSLEDHVEQVFLIECGRCSEQEPLYRDEMAEAVEYAEERGWRVDASGFGVLCAACGEAGP